MNGHNGYQDEQEDYVEQMQSFGLSGVIVSLLLSEVPFVIFFVVVVLIGAYLVTK